MRKNIYDKLTFFLITLIILILVAATGIIAIIYRKYIDDNAEKIYVQQTVFGTRLEQREIAIEQEELIVLEPMVIILNPTSAIKENDNNIRADKFYYNQLNEYGQQIYMQLFNNIDNLKLGNYTIDFGMKFNDLLNSQNGQEILEFAYSTALQAFIYDNPQVFFINVEKMYLTITSYREGNKSRHEVRLSNNESGNYYAEGFVSKAQIDNSISRLEEVKENIIANSNGDTYAKIKNVNNWIVDNVIYDETLEKLHIHEIYGALLEGEAVCSGYSKAFKYILDSMDIPCIIVSGNATNSEGKTESHAWNYVKIGEVWYGVDVTWNSPIIVGGTIAEKQREKEKYRYQYFLKGEKTFSNSHVTNAGRKIIFELPKLSYEDY